MFKRVPLFLARSKETNLTLSPLLTSSTSEKPAFLARFLNVLVFRSSPSLTLFPCRNAPLHLLKMLVTHTQPHLKNESPRRGLALEPSSNCVPDTELNKSTKELSAAFFIPNWLMARSTWCMRRYSSDLDLYSAWSKDRSSCWVVSH